MFEVYGIISGVLLPAGLLSLAYFIYNIKLQNSMIWSFVFQSLATVILGIFYMYSAIVLSKERIIYDESMYNTIDDLAIINDTLYDVNVPMFYQNEINEIEDTRNNKLTSEIFLKNYQSLVETAIRKKLQNITGENRSSRQIKEEPVITDTVENQDCFLRTFLYQALLVYSFVTSALSLLNTCQICKNCSNEPPQENVGNETTKNPSETFGEKIVDDETSDNSSQNAAPVGPLFDDDSIGSSTPNLEVFSVKKKELSDQCKPCTEPVLIERQEENPFLIASKCVAVLVIPIILVIILYFLMKNIHINDNNGESSFDIFLPNLNNTSPNIQIANYIKNFNENVENNSTNPQELNDILHNVYSVINKFQENNKIIKSHAGHYLYTKSQASQENSTKECLNSDTDLKTFDFSIFILLFFAVIFYSKLSETKLTKNHKNNNLNKCFIAFLLMWTPSIIDMVSSRILTTRQPNIFSSLLLLLGNMDNLFSVNQNIKLFKNFIKNNNKVNI